MSDDLRARYRVETHHDDIGWTAKLTDVAYPPIFCLTKDEVEQRVRAVIRDTLRAGNDDFDIVVKDHARALYHAG